ncbi:Putative 3-ketoacyl-CoA thiolase [Acidilobus saccharovorans 345-15]|uniref:Putative 3-ketoacyl-CoA thiolase n=1 Tax=Acidilobus saccharovorans (strain DSM 16705 / JCM 18335 / VKM B-2471 / 345-15) TaxID=666510 RepID=D9PZE6_ACIS3|nr:Putative 3-ketoacyl-CoA thiolase [Acidilobus saccharovorans 345-15]
MRNVAIVGYGHTKFGVRNEVNLAELAYEAIREALEKAGLEPKDVEHVVVSNVGGWSSEPLPAVVVAEYAGLSGKPLHRVEAACASGSSALASAYEAVASGMADIALAVGVEKMNESPTPNVVELIGRAGNYFWEFQNFGLTFPGYYALYATAYMNKYGATEEDFCRVAVKNHYYASMNPKAQFPRKIDLETCMSSRYIAWPIKLYDSSPITDGAAAVVLASEEVAKKLTDSPVWIHSIGMASGTANLSRRDDFTGLMAAQLAARAAYKVAGLEAENTARYFDVAEVHDCFTIAEVMAYEDLGFVKRGEGYKLVREGQTYIGGLIPVNLSGGLKAKGHPLGATGISMAVELTKQLLHEVEPGRQATINKGMAVAHNVGGTGHYAYVTVLGLEKPRGR